MLLPITTLPIVRIVNYVMIENYQGNRFNLQPHSRSSYCLFVELSTRKASWLLSDCICNWTFIICPLVLQHFSTRSRFYSSNFIFFRSNITSKCSNQYHSARVRKISCSRFITTNTIILVGCKIVFSYSTGCTATTTQLPKWTKRKKLS